MPNDINEEKDPARVKYIVSESFSGTKSRMELFSEIILTKFPFSSFSSGQNVDILKPPTGKPYSVFP